MKPFFSLALTLVLTASMMVGCGCTNQNMEGTSAPTVLPTNEEIWNSTESTTRNTTETTQAATGTDTTEETRNINETEVKNGVNAHTEMMDKIREQEKTNKTTGDNSRMIPGSR